MLYPFEIPTLGAQTPCKECDHFVGELRALHSAHSLELEEAFESTEMAEAETRFNSAYTARFRAWMQHKLTHETGSLRRYVALLNQTHA